MSLTKDKAKVTIILRRFILRENQHFFNAASTDLQEKKSTSRASTGASSPTNEIGLVISECDFLYPTKVTRRHCDARCARKSVLSFQFPIHLEVS